MHHTSSLGSELIKVVGKRCRWDEKKEEEREGVEDISEGGSSQSEKVTADWSLASPRRQQPTLGKGRREERQESRSIGGEKSRGIIRERERHAKEREEERGAGERRRRKMWSIQSVWSVF